VVKMRDLPLYNIDLCAPSSARICVEPLLAGTTLHPTDLPIAGIPGFSARFR
jgi:hypothetical protein